jgi:translocation and assembly module TamB
LKSGKINFQGNQPIAPRIDVVAEHQSDGLTVTARAQGPASRPSITLSSVPSLPEEEIVSRVLFGKSRASLSALEAAQLALAVGELTGATGGGPGVLDFARGVLGVDVLRVESGGAAEKGAAVEAGSYVSEDVYIGLKKGLTDNTGAVSVEVEVTPNISLRSETGVTGENDVGVEFNWDY